MPMELLLCHRAVARRLTICDLLNPRRAAVLLQIEDFSVPFGRQQKRRVRSAYQPWIIPQQFVQAVAFLRLLLVLIDDVPLVDPPVQYYFGMASNCFVQRNMRIAYGEPM